MFRFVPGAAVLAASLTAAMVSPAAAADVVGCRPHRPVHHRHVTMRHVPARMVYGRLAPQPHVYNYEDNGRYDGADVPPPRPPIVGQRQSWLDGYGTRPVTYGAYGTYNVYGGSSQVMPYPLPPSGGLAVYSPGSYGPGPSIIEVPRGY